MRSYQYRALTLEQAQQEMRDRKLRKQLEKRKFARQGRRRIVFVQTPEERRAARQARMAARNKVLADDQNQLWFRALSVDNPALQFALLRVLPVFAPSVISRLAQDRFIDQQQLGSALEVLHAF